MWVMSPKGVGILYKVDGDSSEVHLVNSQGETTEVSVCPLYKLRQATWQEIPAMRRSVDREVGRYLGYE